MKRIQRYIAMGASLLIACLLTVAGVLAAGSITTTITVDIQYVGDVRANIYVATYSKAGPGGPYFKDIDTTVENFDTNSNVATIYNKNGNPEEKYQENETNLNNFLDVSQESGHENTFTFADDGYLKFFFLIENLNTTGSLTYTIGLSFGEEKNKDPMGAFTVTDETSEMANVFLLNKQENSSTKSLCTIVFKANQGTKEIETEQINIDITLTQADARPLDFEFVNGEVANSSIKMASTSANTDGAYYQNDRIINEEDEEEIVMLTEGTFVPGKSAEIFNGTEQTATITTLIRSDNFRFDANGNLKLYLLFENSDAENTLTYTITLTYGDDATSPTNFTFNSTDSSALTEVIAVGSSGTPTKSLCTLVFSSATANALYNEKININISLVKTVVEPEP